MLDDNALHDLMTSAAEEQDHLLPGPVTDDTLRGRRRLRRTRLLTAAGSVTAVAAATATVIAGTSVLTGPAEDDTPPAASSSPSISADPTAKQPLPSVRSSVGDLGPAMRAALTRHLDPAREHLQLDDQAIPAFGQPGLRQATAQVGWKITGQQGLGKVWLELADSERAIVKTCGSGRIHGTVEAPCRDVALGNGRTAQVAHDGDEWEIGYVRPDGSVAYVRVLPTFGQNSSIPVHGIGITQDQLLALVQDDSLRMPSMTPGERQVRDRLLAFNPSPTAMSAALQRVLRGTGTLTDPVDFFVPEEASASATYRPAGSTGRLQVTINVDVTSMVSSCKDQLRVDCTERVRLPNGGTGWFGRDAKTGRMGVRYEQPDGDMAFAAVSPKGNASVTLPRDTLLKLVVDPSLDDR